MSEYKLKTGQINFESQVNPGAFVCVVIRDGKFHNLTNDIRQQLIDLLQEEPQEINLEDMF